MHAIIELMISKYPELQGCEKDTTRAYELIKASFESGGKLLVCGNGGSAADCEHIVGEMMKGFMFKRTVPASFRETLVRLFPDEGERLSDRLQGALPAISLVSHSAFMTAFANDVSAETVFAQQVYGYGREGDVLLGLSTSGNSLNVIRAIQVAKALGLRTIGLTGQDGGMMKGLCDVTILIPKNSTPDIQEYHLPIYHALCMMIEEAFFEA